MRLETWTAFLCMRSRKPRSEISYHWAISVLVIFLCSTVSFGCIILAFVCYKIWLIVLRKTHSFQWNGMEWNGMEWSLLFLYVKDRKIFWISHNINKWNFFTNVTCYSKYYKAYIKKVRFWRNKKEWDLSIEYPLPTVSGCTISILNLKGHNPTISDPFFIFAPNFKEPKNKIWILWCFR